MKTKVLIRVVMVLGLIALALAACGRASTALDASEDNTQPDAQVETPVPTQTADPTETSAPTQTPEPTETPSPTQTAEPTETPEPTQTPEPTLDSTRLEQAVMALEYQANMGSLMEDALESLEIVTDAARRENINNSLFSDDEWRATMETSIAEIQSSVDSLQAYEPVPECATRFHNRILAGARSLRESAIAAEEYLSLTSPDWRSRSKLVDLVLAPYDKWALVPPLPDECPDLKLLSPED